MSEGSGPGGSRAAVADHDATGVPEACDRTLLDTAVTALRAQNRAHAARLAAVSSFHANRMAEVAGRDSADVGFFLLTPLQATTAEVAPLLGVSEFFVQLDLEMAEGLQEWFPGLWRRCLEGWLDLGRARLALDQLVNLTSDTDRRAYAELVEEWLDKRDDPRAPLCTVRRSSFQAAVRRRCLRFPQRSEQESYAEAYRKRRVRLRPDENGMAVLSATTALHDAMTADYRLTLIAQRIARQEGEARTLEQLRADVLIDLVHGRLRVGATDGELEEDGSGGDGSRAADPEGLDDRACAFEVVSSVGRFARPVVNVTVAATTLLGLDDEPADMAGGIAIPADLAREIAMQPDAAWYRLLTDPVGETISLSTTRYKPSPPLWRQVVARDRTCVWPECSRPSTSIELDHVLEWPRGQTEASNLQPLCRKHHLVKHSEGFAVVREGDGSYTWTSRFGSVFRTPRRDYPVGRWPEGLPAA